MEPALQGWRSRRPDGPVSPLGLAVIVLVLAVDQASKLWAVAALDPRQPVDILPMQKRRHKAGVCCSSPT